MDLGSILLIVALILLVVLFISLPFYTRRANARLVTESAPTPQADQQRSALLAERDRVLAALQELEFDHTLGKVPEEDYPAQRAALTQAGVEVLRQLDALPGGEDGRGAAPAETSPTGNGRRKLPPLEEDDLETEIAARRRTRQEKAVGFCPKCGAALKKSDRFCSRCGFSIQS